MNIRCIIIEDEPLAQQGLMDYIGETGYLQLCGVAEDPIEGKALLDTTPVDLIFLDMHMPNMSGVQFLETMAPQPAVVICTAYEEYALQGYEFNVVDYLLKPVRFERFQVAVQKVRTLLSNQPSARAKTPVYPDHIYVKSNQVLQKVMVKDILFAEAAGNYVVIHTREKKHMVYLTLKAFEENLSKELFMKVHKSFVVRLGSIESVQLDNISIGGRTIPIGRTFRNQLMEYMDLKRIKRMT